MTEIKERSKYPSKTENKESKEFPSEMVGKLKIEVYEFYDKQRNNGGIPSMEDIGELNQKIVEIFKGEVKGLDEYDMKKNADILRNFFSQFDYNFDIVSIQLMGGYQLNVILHSIEKKENINLVSKYEEISKEINSFPVGTKTPFGKRLSKSDLESIETFIIDRIPRNNTNIFTLSNPLISSYKEYSGSGFQLGTSISNRIFIFKYNSEKFLEKLDKAYNLKLDAREVEKGYINNEIAHQLFWSMIPKKYSMGDFPFNGYYYTIGELSEAHSSLYELNRVTTKNHIICVLVSIFDNDSPSYVFTNSFFADNILKAITGDEYDFPPLKYGERPIFYFQRVLENNDTLVEFQRLFKQMEREIYLYMGTLIKSIKSK